MKLHGFGISDVGVKRDHNEDNFFVDNDRMLYLVADGVGGRNAGEVASKMAVELINDYFRKSASDDQPFIGVYDESVSPEANRLASAVRLANQVVYESSRSNPALSGMGSTVVAVTLSGKKVCIAHVGDSRGYIIHEGEMFQLTDDHSLVEEQLRQGLISEKEARESNIKNVITRALGAAEDVNVDIDEQPVAPGDIILACSDGLSNMVSDEIILNVVNASKGNLDQACRELIRLANENGGKDNITVVLIKVLKTGFLGFFRNLGL